MPEKKDFEFIPRPDAQAMEWEQLLSPVGKAVRDLLIRIDGSTHNLKQRTSASSTNKNDNISANCFLVYGERGTGKTTVLLSAKKACEHMDSFFNTSRKIIDDRKSYGEAKNRAENLQKNIVWLDILDLEPLPPGANLLAVLLTRLSNAIYENSNNNNELTSILEESANSARHQLTKLLNDATLMWEDIHENDTRSRANRQIAAADIYSHFGKRFKEAMETLSKEICRRRNGHEDDTYIFVLPIDNIDRSTEHLNNMVKLALMVSCPHLRLIMAGDRQDVETFLERAYWKELISVGKTVGATGKTSESGEDESLVMARRQAAAALHKLLPPGHRIEVGLVPPEETLNFTPFQLYENRESLHNETIRNLLSRVGENKSKVGQGRCKIKFIDLFDISNIVKNGEKKLIHQNLTSAGKIALRLPSRGVLDLWQLAYWVVNDDTVTKDFEAETIAISMLRNTTTESNISSNLGNFLQKKVIRHRPFGGTQLEFPKDKREDGGQYWRFYPNHLWFLEYDFYVTQNTISLTKNTEDKYLSFPKPKRLIVSSTHMMAWFYSNEYDSDPEVLPSTTSGWFTILFEALIWCSSASTILDPPPIFFQRSIVTHYGDQDKPFMWPLPEWKSFVEFNIFIHNWNYILSEIHENNIIDNCSKYGIIAPVLCIAWIASVLQTYQSISSKSCRQELIHSTSDNLHQILLNFIEQRTDGETLKNKLLNTVIETIKEASRVYEEILSVNASNGTLIRREEHTYSMIVWSEVSLLKLLKETSSLPDIYALNSLPNIDTLKNMKLVKVWGIFQNTNDGKANYPPAPSSSQVFTDTNEKEKA